MICEYRPNVCDCIRLSGTIVKMLNKCNVAEEKHGCCFDLGVKNLLCFQILVCPCIKAKLTLNSWPEFKNTTRSGNTIQLDLCQERSVVYSYTPSSKFEMKVKK